MNGVEGEGGGGLHTLGEGGAASSSVQILLEFRPNPNIVCNLAFLFTVAIIRQLSQPTQLTDTHKTVGDGCRAQRCGFPSRPPTLAACMRVHAEERLPANLSS